MRITADDLLRFGIVDGIVPEPPGGAHTDHAAAAQALRSALVEQLAELEPLSVDELLARRAARYRVDWRLRRLISPVRDGLPSQSGRAAGQRALPPTSRRSASSSRDRSRTIQSPWPTVRSRPSSGPSCGVSSRARPARRRATRRYRRRRRVRVGARSDRRYGQFRLALPTVGRVHGAAAAWCTSCRLHLGAGWTNTRPRCVPRSAGRRGVVRRSSACVSPRPPTNAASSWGCQAAICAPFVSDGPAQARHVPRARCPMLVRSAAARRS